MRSQVGNSCLVILLLFNCNFCLCKQSEDHAFKSSVNSFTDQEYRTSPHELGIEPYGEEAAQRIWSPSRLVPAEEWSGFYSGPVSDEWMSVANSEQVTSNETAADPEPSTEYQPQYTDTPPRSTPQPLTPMVPGTTVAPFANFNDSETSLDGESSQNHESENYEHEDQKFTIETEPEVERVSSHGLASSFQYQVGGHESSSITSDNENGHSVTSEVDNGHETSESGSKGISLIRAQSRIETDDLKHEAVHFNQTVPVVYDPVARESAKTDYLKHSPLSKHDPFDGKIHSYQYIFGEGPDRNDGKLHSFEETHEYHFPNKKIFEQGSSSNFQPQVVINFQRRGREQFRHEASAGPVDRFGLSPSSSSRMDTNYDDGKASRQRRSGRLPPNVAYQKTYFYQDDPSQSYSHEEHSPRERPRGHGDHGDTSASKNVEINLHDRHGGKGHVSACFGKACQFRPKSPYSGGHDDQPLSPLAPFGSFFKTSTNNEAPKYHSTFDDDLPPRRDHSSPPPSRWPPSHRRDYDQQSSSDYPKKPRYNSSPRPFVKSTKPHVRHFFDDQQKSGHHFQGHRRIPPRVETSYHEPERDFHERRSASNSRAMRHHDDVSHGDIGHGDIGHGHNYRSSKIPEPGPYYGPYERYFPDLLSDSSSSSFGESSSFRDNLIQPVLQQPSMHFNQANQMQLLPHNMFPPLAHFL